MKQASIFKMFLLIAALLSLSSCSFLHKVTDRKREHVKESVKISSDSTSKKTSDSVGSKVSDSSTVKKSQELKTSDVQIEFADSSDHNKVEITTDSNGKQTIKAEGNIKSIRTKRKEQKQNIDLARVQNKESVSKSSTENTSVKKRVDSTKNNSSSSISKKKTSFGIHWYGYLIGILVLLAIAIYVYQRYRFQIIAWFIRLKNPGSNVYYDPKIKGYQIISKKKKNSS